MQMAGPRGLPASDIERNDNRSTTLPPLQTNPYLRPETPNAGSGRSLAQQVLDVLLPTRRSNELCRTTDPASLEQTRGVSFLQRDREPRVPCIQKSNFPPVARRCDLRIALCDGVNRSSEPLQCLGAPATECFSSERNQASSWKSPSRITTVLTFGSPCSSCAIRVSCSMEPGAPLRMRHYDVAVDERIGRWTAKSVVQTRLLHLKLPLSVCPASGPRRLEDLSRADEPSCAADPREDIPQGVVPADHEAAHATGERVKPVGIERFGALAASRARCHLLRRISAPLVATPARLISETEGNAKTETGAHPKLQVREPRCHRGGRRQKPRTGTRPTTPPKPSSRRRSHRRKETAPRRFRTFPREKALPLGESRGSILPSPRLRRGVCRHLTDLV